MPKNIEITPKFVAVVRDFLREKNPVMKFALNGVLKEPTWYEWCKKAKETESFPVDFRGVADLCVILNHEAALPLEASALGLDDETCNMISRALEERNIFVPHVDLASLPTPPNSNQLVLRDGIIAELQKHWTAGRTNILQLVADGGMGKSTILWSWLMNPDRPRGGDIKNAFYWRYEITGSSAQNPGGR